MKRCPLLPALILCIALLMVSCSPPNAGAAPLPSATAAAALSHAAPTAAPVQAAATPDDPFSLSVPYQTYPQDIESIIVTVHIPAGERVFGALAPQLERLTDGEWTALRGMGYCGTPDEIKDGARMPLPVGSYDGISPGEYRVSLSVSEDLKLETDMQAYAYFILTEGVRVTADPRPYAADAGDLTLVVLNPSEGRVTLADTEIQIEMKDNGDWIGCGPASALGSLALEPGEKDWFSAELSGFNLPSGTYRAIVVLSRLFHGEEIREVRMPEFQVK